MFEGAVWGQAGSRGSWKKGTEDVIKYLLSALQETPSSQLQMINPAGTGVFQKE